MRRLGSLLIGAGLATLLFPAAALGCTTPQSQPLEQVVQDEEMFGEQLVGVHEQRHIARFPAVPILVNERSASVVVRYWGEEPDLSVASHGDEGIFLVIETSCG